MATDKVRDIEHKFNLWGGYRDELIATSMALSLIVLGSFIVIDRGTPKKTNIPSPTPQALGIQTTASPDPSQSDTSTTVVSVKPTPTPDMTEWTETIYGEDGTYDFESYSISFRSPILQFDKVTKMKRRLRVSVWIKNKSVADGLPVRIVGSIIKDGVVIVKEAPLYVPSSRLIHPGEEMTYEATLPLIEGTDIRELKYKPGTDLPEGSHFLYP